MQVVDASGNMFGYDSITVAGPDGRPKTISTAIKLVTLVRNTSGATITKGTIVYINGGSGNKPTITKALATSDATSAQTYGVVQANIPNNKNGYVVVIGALDGLNTSAYSPGTQLYLSSTIAGEWTSVKQLAPNHLVYVGIVVRQHATQGVVEVKIQNGYELDEIHDVQIVSPTNGQTLVYDSATSLWKNGSGGSGGASWGSISGTLSSQTDLQTALDAKQDDLVSGINIKTVNGSSVLGGGNLVVSGGGVHLPLKQGAKYTNQQVSMFSNATTSQAQMVTPNQMSFAPFLPANSYTFNRIDIGVTVASASSTFRVLIYSDNDGIPQNKLYESANIDGSTTGQKIINLTSPFTFIGGETYWIAIHASGSSANITFSGVSVNSLIGIFIQGGAVFNRLNTSMFLYVNGSPSTINLLGTQYTYQQGFPQLNFWKV